MEAVEKGLNKINPFISKFKRNYSAALYAYGYLLWFGFTVKMK